MRNVTKCPITSFEVVTKNTVGAIDLGSDQYVLPRRNESEDALPVNDIIIHEAVPCVGGICRNSRTQLLKSGICDSTICKDDTRWKKLVSTNETSIYKAHGIPVGLGISTVRYYLSYRHEILWRRGARIPSLADQKNFLTKSNIFPLIPYFYEFAFYLTIADFISLSVIVPILALCTDRLRYNFFPERMHISRVDTLNQLGLVADSIAGNLTIY